MATKPGMNFNKPPAKPSAAKPAAKPPAAGIKLAVGQAGSNPQRAISPPNSARSNTSNPQRAVSPPSASNGRAPLEHKNSQVGLGRPAGDPKNKATYGTMIRNWNNTTASKANLSMLEKKNLVPLTLLHRNNNVKVQSVATEVIDSLVELSDGSVGMDPSKVNGFRPLVDLCKREDIDSEIPVLVLQSLAYLAAHHTCRAPILSEVGWFNIPKFARSSDPEMRTACAMLLGNLSHEVANQKSIIEKGVPLLQENIKEATTPEMKAAFLSAFADISQIKEYGAQEIWDKSLLQFTLPPIKGSNHTEIFAAVSLLCNICDTPTISVHKEIVESGVVDKLYDLLKSDSDEMQANVALIFARLGKSSVGRQKLESLSSYRNLIDRMLSKVPGTQFQVAGALDVLADSDAIKKILKKEDCVEVLQEVILSTSGHAQVEELALNVLKKLDADRWKVVAEKHTNKVRAIADSAASEETLQFSPRSAASAPPEQKVSKPAAGEVPQPRNRVSVKLQPLQSLTPSSVDADRMQKDHQMEIQKLQDEKKRLEDLLKKERDAERESSKYTAASPGSNIDDKIKGSLKSIQDGINLEVDLLGDERRKIEEWKRAIENFRGERIIYEKDLEIFRKDKDHFSKEKEQVDKEKQHLQTESDKLDKEKKNLHSENDKLEKERSKLQDELAALAKSREKLEREKAEFEKERETERAAFKGKSELSSLDKERADREKEKAERAEKEREKMENERDEAEKERKKLEQLLESERQKHKLELEEEKRKREEEERRREEERERNAKGNKSEEEKQAALVALQQDYEEITLKFEKEKKKFEREKEQMQAEIEILKESSGRKMQRMISLLEDNLEESKKTNKLLEGKVEELEEELRRLRSDRNSSDSDLQAELDEERRRLEELAKKYAEAQEELEKRNRGDGQDEDEPDLDERQRRQIVEDLKKIEEWEKAKEREKIENQKKLDEEIEFLKQRHASWERKQAIAMADLIEKEKTLYDKENNLKKYDDELYERLTKIQDAETRPSRSRSRDYSDSDRSYSDDDDYESRRHSSDDWSDDDSDEDRTLSLSSSSESDYTIDSPRDKKRNKDKEREQRERERLEKEREEKKRLAQKASSPKPKSPIPKSTTPSIRPKSGLKSSSGLKASSGLRASSGLAKPGTPKPRPPIDYMDTMDDVDDDDDDLFSVEGLAQSDPYEAARKLLALLELDPSRSTESDIATLKKFAKNRSGAPTQYEARDIIPTLIHILRLCTDPSHEEIINTCLLILAILAYNKDANQLYIRRAQGGPLFEIFLSFSVVSVKARAALAIAAYCLNNVSIKNEMGQTVVATLCVMLKDADPVIKKAASTALASLADNNKYNKKIVKKQGGVKTLLDLMRDNQIPAKYSLHLLASLAHDSKSIKKEVPKHFPNVFRKVILLLSPFTKPSVLSAAVACLMELARNSPSNQKSIWKAKATNYLVTILINKDRYNNDDLVVNTLFLCWIIARISPKGLADKEFYDPKWSMADILKTLKETNNEVIKKIIYQMETMIRTADVAGKAEKGERERKGGERSPSRPSPTPPPSSSSPAPSPLSLSSTPAVAPPSPLSLSSSSASAVNNNNNNNNNNNGNGLSSSSRLSASVQGVSRGTPSPQPGPSAPKS